MWMVSLCAGLALIQSSLTDSCASLFIALAAVLGAVLVEFLANYLSGKQTLQDGSAIASALVFSLLLPNHIHPVFAFLGAIFALGVVKHSFGGLGANWVNPALGGWLFVRFSWPGVFNTALEGSSLGTLSAGLDTGILDPHGSPLRILESVNLGTSVSSSGFLDTALTPLLNKTIFLITGSELPGGYIDLLFYSGPGIIADRGLFALLLGTIIIIAVQASRLWIPLIYLGVYSLFIRLFGALPFGGDPGAGDMLFGLFSGGTMAAAFLLAADPSTGPKSRIGVFIAAVLGGLASFMFRYLGFEQYGAFFAILLLNVLVPLIRYFEYRSLYFHGSGANGRSAMGPVSLGGFHEKW
jgi:electron transport complex protein RnfD